jgi:hypothetical protein
MGRPRKDPAGRKSVPISIRFSPELRTRLDDERKKDGQERTLTQEIERRLWESLDLDARIEERFHGRLNYWFMQIAADGIQEIEELTKKPCWEDAFTFSQAKLLIHTLLKYLRPKGKRSVPKYLGPDRVPRELPNSLGANIAWLTLANHQVAALKEDFPGPLPGAERVHARVRAPALKIISQLARSGRSPLDEDSETARLWRQKARKESV